MRALAGESAELLQTVRWLTPQQSTQVMQDDERAVQVREEMADVLVVDLEEAWAEKFENNNRTYPVHLAWGKADKYTQLEG